MKLLFVLLLLWASAARAAGTCPGDTNEPLPAREKLPALERELAAMAGECAGHAGYLAYRGAVLNALGRPAEAAVLLERALLLDPQRAGAELDYAQALAALGDHASAESLLKDVLARPDVPEQLRPQLAQRLDAIGIMRRGDALAALSSGSALTGTGWQTTGSVTAKLGRDNNLNSAPAHNVLTLTLPEGNATLMLADRFLPRAGNAGLVEANGQLARTVGDSAGIQLFGEARMRGSPEASDTNYQQVQGGGAWGQKIATGTVFVSASANQLVYGGEALYRAARLSVGHDWQIDRCRPGLGLEVEWRRYPVAPDLDGRFAGASGGAICTIGTDQLALRLRAGRDQEQGNRPGGDQNQADVRLVWSRPLASGRLGADFQWYHLQDTSGYSPLLANDATRRLDRVSLYLEYAHPITPSWSAVASVEVLNQRSNLELFDISGRAFYLGLRWTAGR